MNETLEYIFEKHKPTKDRKLPWVITDIDRNSIPKTLGELGFKVGAEVGVAQGNHAKTLCTYIPGVKLYCIDCWERYKGYREYTNRIKGYYKEAQERLAPFDCVFMKMFSMEAVEKFERGSLDFVYIDAAHDFLHIAQDIYKWSPKVRHGGVVFGHDYKRRRGARDKSRYIVNVRGVVQTFMYEHDIDPWFHLKISRQDSWMFVRQKGDLVDRI